MRKRGMTTQQDFTQLTAGCGQLTTGECGNCAIKAIEIAATSGQWLKCRSTDGQKAYGVPSQVQARPLLPRDEAVLRLRRLQAPQSQPRAPR